MPELYKNFDANGKSFQINRYDMTYRLVMLGKLAKILSGPAKHLNLSELKGESGNKESATIKVVATLVEGIFETLPPEEFPEICKQFLKGTKLKGQNALVNVTEVFDATFESVSDLFELLKEVIVFQFGSDLQRIFGRFLESFATQTEPEAVAKTPVTRIKAK